MLLHSSSVNRRRRAQIEDFGRCASVCRRPCEIPLRAQAWVSLLRQLLSDHDAWVVRVALRALQVLAFKNPRLALELAMGVDPGHDGKLADELLSTLTPGHRGSLREMDPQVVEQLLGKLQDVEDLDEYWIREFLS